ncbi:hypothetical protein E3U55_06660 [Filobacillus milosensis]|uniref:YCII-related domain-containing protein n=1 Tax=Filobacillus milosensis TaxID=94137 RepID=A0A4Y8IQG7_9BACI|nr:YciI family protein [Filobacillus milosensis]TFB22916.1 hypothetical protein E3U55_06660 [Filobacillus milosensis]
MKHFAVFLPMKDEEKSNQYRPEHLKFIEKMHAEGIVPLYGRFTDGDGGLIIYKARDLDEAITFVKQDPYVDHGARGFEIHEWDINRNL